MKNFILTSCDLSILTNYLSKKILFPERFINMQICKKMRKIVLEKIEDHLK